MWTSAEREAITAQSHTRDADERRVATRGGITAAIDLCAPTNKYEFELSSTERSEGGRNRTRLARDDDRRAERVGNRRRAFIILRWPCVLHGFFDSLYARSKVREYLRSQRLREYVSRLTCCLHPFEYDRFVHDALTDVVEADLDVLRALTDASVVLSECDRSLIVASERSRRPLDGYTALSEYTSDPCYLTCAV